MERNLDPNIKEKGNRLAELLFAADATFRAGDHAAAAALAKSARNVAREIGVPSLNREADWRVLQFSMRALAEHVAKAQAAGGRADSSSTDLTIWVSDAWQSGLALVANPTITGLPDALSQDLRRIATLIVANDPTGSTDQADHLRGISESRWKALVSEASSKQIQAVRLTEWLHPILSQQPDLSATTKHQVGEQVNDLLQEADRLFGSLQYAEAIETLTKARQLAEPYQQQQPTIVPAIDRLILRRCYEAHIEAMAGKAQISPDKIWSAIQTWLEMAWDAAVRVLNTSPEHVPGLDRPHFIEGLREIVGPLVLVDGDLPSVSDPKWFELCKRAVSERVPGSKIAGWFVAATGMRSGSAEF